MAKVRTVQWYDWQSEREFEFVHFMFDEMIPSGRAEDHTLRI